MNIFDKIKSNKFAITKFTEYLINNNHDTKKILLNTNHLETLSYYIEFLEFNRIFIITDHNGYVIYKQLNEENQIFIYGQMLSNNIIAKLISGIIKGFEYIETETPF